MTTETPTTFRLMRDKAIDLEFTGWLLADESSRLDRPAPSSGVTWTEGEGRDRWMEVRIYRTDSKKYVVELIGQSTLDGEVPRRTVRICNTPDKVPAALRVGSFKNLTNVAVDALNEAADKDPDLRAGLVERI
jgi:hypothetical protein